MTPAPEKAAPIPADVAALAWRVVDTLWMGSHEKTDARRTIEREVMALLADQASQEERIREDERAKCARQLHQLALLEKERAEEAPPGERRKAARWAAAKLCMAAGQIAPNGGAS